MNNVLITHVRKQKITVSHVMYTILVHKQDNNKHYRRGYARLLAATVLL